MKQTYRVLAGLIALGVVVQAAAIALAWFGVIADIEDGGTFTSDSDGNVGHALHGIVGMMVIPLLALVLFVISFFAKVRSGTKYAGLLLLAVVVQVVLAFVAFGVPAVGALHGINALVIFGLALATARQAGLDTVGGATGAHGGIPQQSGASQQSSSV